MIADGYISGRIEELKAKYKEAAETEDKHAVLAQIQKLQRKLKSKNVKEKF
mgnify:FL=1